MPEPTRAAPFRTLLVDDDGAFRFLLRSELEASGRFEVVGEAADGAEGLLAAQHLRGQVDFVLLDLDMPVMDGMQALPLLAQALPRAHVVVLSMRGGKESDAQVRDLGGTACLDKALDGDAVIRRLLALARHPPARVPPVPHRAHVPLPTR